MNSTNQTFFNKLSPRIVNGLLNFISIVFTATTLYLFERNYRPIIEIEWKILILFPGVFGVTLFLSRFTPNQVKKYYIFLLHLVAGVGSLFILCDMLYNWGSPLYNPLLNKILVLLFIASWDTILIGSAKLLKLTIEQQAQRAEGQIQSTQVKTNRANDLETHYQLVEEENPNFCPVHGFHSSQ